MLKLQQTLCVVASLAGVSHALGGITITPLGTAAPPIVVDIPGAGLAPLYPAMDDTSPLFSDVSSASLDFGTNVYFSIPLSHREIGSGWSIWSHGYTGDVYYTGGASSVMLSLEQIGPGGGIDAFYFYAEPNFFGLHPMTITAAGDGATQTVSAMVEGSAGAQGWLVAVFDQIDTITISTDDGIDFAVGEFGFGMWIPSPGALALLGLVGLARRRHRD